MARVINFVRAMPNGRVETMSVDESTTVENSVGIAWKVFGGDIRIIPYTQIFDITIKER